MQKATLEALLERKTQAMKAKMAVKEINVPVLGMALTVEKLPLARVLNLIDKYKDDDSLNGKFELYKELIYISVPLFRSAQLQEAYEVAEPSDIVTLLFEQNLTAITNLGDNIAAMYGINGAEAVEELKKLISSDSELYTIHYYLERGHSLHELVGMSSLELLFLTASMILTGEEKEKSMASKNINILMSLQDRFSAPMKNITNLTKEQEKQLKRSQKCSCKIWP